MIDFEEQDLREALRPVRPDAQAFRRAIERKLAEREASDETQAPAVGWRSAAGLLPLGVFGPATAGTKVAFGPLPAAKGLFAALSLPAVALAMLAWTAVAGLIALSGLRTSASATRQAAEQLAREWWRQHILHAGVALALLLVLAWTLPAEAVMFVLLVSMLALIGFLMRLSRAGAASSESIGALTANLLGALTALVFLASKVSGVDAPDWADPWVPFALFAGCQACDLVGNWRAGWSPMRKLAGLGLPIVFFGWVGQQMYSGLRSVDRSRVDNYVERFDAPLEDVVEWRRLGAVREWLQASGGAQSLATRARGVVDGEIALLEPDETLLDSTAPTHSLLGAARAGLLPEHVWEPIRSAPRISSLLGLDGRLLESAITEWALRAMLRGPLDDAERDRLAARLDAAWPEPEEDRALEALAFYDKMCALLERAPRRPDARELAHRALTSHWAGAASSDGSAAAFVTDLDRMQQSEADIMRIEPTRAALRLMRRFGVPEGVDLDAVEAFLRRAATPSLVEVLAPEWIDALTVQSYRFTAEVGLHELASLRAEQGLAVAPSSALARLLDARLLLGSLALVLLCLFANVRARLFDRRHAAAAS